MRGQALEKNLPPEALENSVFDDDNPTALINVMPLRFVPIIKRVKEKLPRFLLYAEVDLRFHIKPSERDERLRLAFWDEYNQATTLDKRMSLQNILGQIIEPKLFAAVYEPDDKLMLWIFTPPKSYVHSMRYIMHKGLERLQEIMEMPMTYDDKFGQKRLDHKAATLILKAFQLVDLRVQGSIVQHININQKNLNLNAEVSQAQLAGQVESQINMLSLDELEKLDRKLDRTHTRHDVEVHSLPPAEQDEVKEIQHEIEIDKQKDRLPALPIGDELKEDIRL